MHQEVMDWLRMIRGERPEIFHGSNVIEFGSLNINGTPRVLFTECDYVGVDWRDGPDVDVVCLAHKYTDWRLFDVGISTEMLEHDPYWADSVSNMVSFLRQGGDMLLTFGGEHRAEHEVDTSPKEGYYNGLPAWKVYSHIQGKFEIVRIWDDGNDVYMWCEGKR